MGSAKLTKFDIQRMSSLGKAQPFNAEGRAYNQIMVTKCPQGEIDIEMNEHDLAYSVIIYDELTIE